MTAHPTCVFWHTPRAAPSGGGREAAIDVGQGKKAESFAKHRNFWTCAYGFANNFRERDICCECNAPKRRPSAAIAATAGAAPGLVPETALMDWRRSPSVFCRRPQDLPVAKFGFVFSPASTPHGPRFLRSGVRGSPVPFVHFVFTHASSSDALEFLGVARRAGVGTTTAYPLSHSPASSADEGDPWFAPAFRKWCQEFGSSPRPLAHRLPSHRHLAPLLPSHWRCSCGVGPRRRGCRRRGWRWKCRRGPWRRNCCHRRWRCRCGGGPWRSGCRRRRWRCKCGVGRWRSGCRR